jgi:hypothetical protein
MLKAIYAGVGAALAGIGTALVGAQTFGNVSDAQWITIAALALGAFGAVYGVTNSPAVGGSSGTT